MKTIEAGSKTSFYHKHVLNFWLKTALFVIPVLVVCTNSFAKNTSFGRFVDGKEKPDTTDPIEHQAVLHLDEVDQKPRFYAHRCENTANVAISVKEACAERALADFFYEHLHYPEDVFKAGIEGFVEIQFVITESGKIEDIEVVQDIGYGCGEEVLRVVGLMGEVRKPWIPALLNDKPVSVNFTLPVFFLLDKVQKMLLSKEDEKIYALQDVDVKPRFYHRFCENIEDMKEKDLCAHNEFMNFINQNLVYPPEAKNARMDGRVDVRFIVDKDGEIGGVGIINHFGYGSKEEALRLIHLMKEESLIWKPGVLDGKLVHTAYDVTIRFQR